MVYQYVAYNENGQVVKGKLSAASEEAVTDLPSYAGYQALTLKPYVPFLNLDKLSASLFRVKPTEIILLYRQLASRVIFTTGDVMGRDTQSFLEQADRPFLPKPFTPDELRTVLGEILKEVENDYKTSKSTGC